jgi:riboflavin synthase alpha subunit
MEADFDLHEPLFRGRVQQVARVEKLEPLADGTGTNLTFSLTAPLHRFGDRQLVAVNGVCMTVQHMTDTHLSVTMWERTGRVTNLSGLRQGDAVNLELAELGLIVAETEAH